MANAVMEAAATTPGKEAIAMEAFAKALSELPTAIAENGGFDSAQLVSELRALHKQNKSTMGLGETWFKNLCLEDLRTFIKFKIQGTDIPPGTRFAYTYRVFV